MNLKYDPILGVLRKADGEQSGGGIDTSDATATASDILQDKTAYGADGKLTGTIPTVTASMSDNVVTVPKGYVKSAQTLTVGTALNAYTITPAANAQVISKGSYLKGEVTVSGDANLTASNIKSGVTIFNVAGTYEGESSGGTSAEYYKCASVDTSAKTWSGYKAVFNSGTGTWSFEDTVTEGLSYTSVTPIVGGIYSADALVNVAFLYDDMRNICTAYYKLDGNYRDSVNMYDGIPNKTTFVDGKIGRSAHTNGSSQYISLPNEVSVKGRTQVSYSGWCFIESNPNEDFYIITEVATYNGYTRAAFGVNAALLPFAGVRTVATGDTGSFQKVTGTSPISKSTWYFLCAVFDLSNGNIILYVNGVVVGSLTIALSSFVDSDPYRIRIFEFDSSGSGNIRVDEVGIWSKALSADEVSELYNNGAGKSL